MPRVQPQTSITGGHFVVRAATSGDVGDIVRIWTTGWRDAHEGHVPTELITARSPASFSVRAAERVAQTTVIEADGEVAGFITVIGDELEQLYVDRRWRGAGVAGTLIGEAERRAADAGHQEIWLAVVAGNTRARRFFSRAGWRDDGEGVYSASVAGGRPPVSVPVRRYVKFLRHQPRSSQPSTYAEKDPT